MARRVDCPGISLRLLVVSSVLTFLSSVASACPTSCTCTEAAPFLTACANANLTEIPSGIPENTEELFLKGNSIRVLGEGAFGALGSLKRLVFSYNNLESIESNAFVGLGNLIDLDLHQNRLSSLPVHAFSGLFGLKTLKLYSNNIQSIADQAFHDVNLTSLELENNPNLMEIAAGAFENAGINSINVFGSNLSSRSLDAFKALKSTLQELHLQENRQPLSLPADIFEGFKFIKLNLDKNGISDATFLRHVSADYLSLVGNPVGPLDFRQYPRLRTVQSLDLSTTKFSRLSHDYFQPLQQLESLHLQQNGITTIPEAMRPVIQNLRSLKLDGNPLHCNCELKWFKKWLAKNSGTQGVDVTGAECSTPYAEEVSAVDEENMQCSAPKIIDITKDLKVRQGTQLAISCTAQGDPSPDILWELPDGRRKTYQPSFNRTQTTVQKDYMKNVWKSDAGISRCVATNLFGNDSAVVNVTVLDPLPSAAAAAYAMPVILLMTSGLLFLGVADSC